MRLKTVEIENFRAIHHLEFSLDPDLTVFHGNNANGKTSVLGAIAVGLGAISTLLPDVAGISFKDSDRRKGSTNSLISLKSTEEIEWHRRVSQKRGADSRKFLGTKQLKQSLSDLIESELTDSITLPIFAYYDTDRAVFDLPQRRRDFKNEFKRFGALEGSLVAKSNFRAIFEWFNAKQHEELIEQRERRSFNYYLKDLESVRRAICLMIPGASNPRIEIKPLRFVVSIESESNRKETLSLSELSGGYRIMLAMVADLARRMAQGNPHLDDPLDAEAIVLIDEIDLHLHPSWQQRVLSDLRRTFKNAQFIVSTHSPQVLSTVEPWRIMRLARSADGVFAEEADSATYGAESGKILQIEMGVEERPKNEFSDKLAEYFRLIDEDSHHSDRGMELRLRLQELSPRDTGLTRADGEIRRRSVLKSIGRKP